MSTVYPFPGNPNATGSRMPAGLAAPPPKSGGPGAMAGSVTGGGSVYQEPAGGNAPTPRPTFAMPPGTTAGSGASSQVPPAMSQAQAPPPASTTGGPQWYGQNMSSPMSQVNPPPQLPATPLAGAPWYWRYPIGAYYLAARVPWWVWLGVGVGVGVGGTVYVQRRRRKVGST